MFCEESVVHVLVIASRKGGAGKTTLASHLAVEAERRGDGPVAAIDADPMAGLVGWFDARKAETPFCVEQASLSSRGLRGTLDGLQAAGVQLVIVDTAPSASNDVGKLVAAADLVLVPVIPSPNDFRAIGETLDLVDEAGKPILFVVNNAAANAKLTNQALTLLSQHGTVAAIGDQPVIIRTRTDFRSSMTDGRTVGEIKASSKSAEEIANLWTAVKVKLERESRRGRATTAA
jgi:chromosome partitioning protein